MPHSRVRDGVAIASIIILANGPLLFVARKFFSLPGAWEDPLVRPVLVATVLASVAIVALDRSRLSGRRLREPNRVALGAAVGLGLWAVASSLWSVNPDPSRWRGLMYVGLPFVAWGIADLDDRRFIRALVAAIGALIAVSLVLVVMWDGTALDHRGDWRGIFTNRNGFAPVAGLGAVLGIGILLQRRWLTGSVLMVGSLAGLLGSGSRTPLLALAIAAGTASVVTIARADFLKSERRWVLGAAAGVLAAGATAVVAVVAALWDESTFDQRRTIWSELSDHIADAPIHGIGWDSFWTVPELIAQHELLNRGSAHSSVVELLLGVGVIGLGLWLVVVTLALRGALIDAWRRPGAQSWLFLAITIFLVVENLTESFVLWFSYNWVLLIALALRGGRMQPTPIAQTPAPTAVATG